MFDFFFEWNEFLTYIYIYTTTTTTTALKTIQTCSNKKKTTVKKPNSGQPDYFKRIIKKIICGEFNSEQEYVKKKHYRTEYGVSTVYFKKQILYNAQSGVT